jgi:hypothetical protein
VQTVLTIVYFTGILAQIIIRAPYARQARKVEKVHIQVTAYEQVILGVLTFGGLVCLWSTF